MKRLVVCLLALMVGSPLVFLGCRSGILSQGDHPAGAALPTLQHAEALSKHYVQLAFTEPVGDEGEVSSTYKITAPDSTPLEVESARVIGDGTLVILTTGP